jgi:hypothetical protein
MPPFFWLLSIAAGPKLLALVRTREEAGRARLPCTATDTGRAAEEEEEEELE